MKRMRKLLILGAAALLLLGLTACETAIVQINDGGVVTEVETKLPRTVEDILSDAEITLNDGDEVQPSLETKLSEAQEIVIARKMTVTLTANGESSEVEIVGGTVADLLEQENIVPAENQKVSPEADTYLKDGMEVIVADQLSVEIQCDGETRTQTVESATVGDVLKECNITLGENDRVTPAADTAVSAGMQIVVNRVTIETTVETESIPYETTYEDDSSLEKGKEQTVTGGEDGQKEVTYQITRVDGVEESREAVSENVTKEAVNAVVRRGTKSASSSAASSGSSSQNSSSGSSSSGKTVVSRKNYDDCDGSGHGYTEIQWSDGTTTYEEY